MDTRYPGQKLLSIISTMLKAEVAGIGFPEKGTPQGGIISPLLSNIVLNELDWWIVSQWEEMPTQRNYVHRIYANGTPDKSSTIRTLRNYTNLKECYVVRYADDFKIFCKSGQMQSSCSRQRNNGFWNVWDWKPARRNRKS